jgi:long-chain fatty acid transport protein
MSRFLGLCLLGLAVVLAAAAPASAQGFGVYEQGACMMGRAGAGVADPCQDGSGVFFNPASLSFTNTTLTLGAAVIHPYGSFTDTSGGALDGTVSTLNSKWYPVPNIYASMPFRQRFAFGVGVFAPYGLETDWPATSQGRYLGYKSTVQGVYIQPTVSYKVNDKVSIGGGIDITYLNVELRQRVDLSVQPLGTTGLTFAQLNLVCPESVCGTVPYGTDFADVKLSGNSWHAGYHLGFQAKVNDQFSIGARYLSGQSVNVSDGTIATTQISVPGVKVPVSTTNGTVFVPVDQVLAPKFATGGTLSDQSATTTLSLPAQFVAGVAFKATPAVELFADYQFTHWSDFSVLPINGEYLKSVIPENYTDVHGLRVGTEIKLSKQAVVRGGVNLHGPAAPDETVTPNLPEGSRREFNVGFGYTLTDRVRLDAAYMYLYQPDREGRTTSGPNNGVYSFRAHLLSASATILF